jgi:hypothetical protein
MGGFSLSSSSERAVTSRRRGASEGMEVTVDTGGRSLRSYDLTARVGGRYATKARGFGLRRA